MSFFEDTRNSIQDARKSLDNTKKEEVGIGKYTLFAKIDESTKYSSVVPVEVLEDGTSATDDILNNPTSISMSGVVGDLIVEVPSPPTLINKDFSAVGEITALLPARSQQQIQRASQIDSQLRDATLLAQRVERIAGNAYDLFNNSASTVKSQQEKFVEYMEQVHTNRKPVKISTKYKEYNDMALAELTISSDNQTNDLKFTASFVEVKYLKLVYATVSKDYATPSNAVQGKTQDESDKGGQNPEENEEKVSSVIFSLSN